MTKETKSYYNNTWIETNQQKKLPNIGWIYDKTHIDNTLLKYAKESLTKDTNILEMGVGKGDFASKLCLETKNYPLKYLGIDISDAGINIARQKVDSRFQFLVADADGTLLPLKSNQYDIIICSEVIEHINMKYEMLTELYRVLKSGGCLLLTTPNPNSLTYFLPRLINGSGIFSFPYGSDQPVNDLVCRKDLQEMLTKLHFRINIHSALVFRPFSLSMIEDKLKKPIVLLRWISEFFEKEQLFSQLGLYQVVVAEK